MRNGGPISWKSCRHFELSLSTPEAEFVAASRARQEALYLRETLKILVISNTMQQKSMRMI